MGSQIIRRFQNMFEIFGANKTKHRIPWKKNFLFQQSRYIFWSKNIGKVLWGADFLPLYTATPRPDEVTFKKNGVNEGGDEVTFLRRGK